MRASPTVAQMLAIGFLIGLSLCLSLIGPDYISVSANASERRDNGRATLTAAFSAHHLHFRWQMCLSICLRKRRRYSPAACSL